MVAFDTKSVKVRKNLVSSRLAIVLTTVGGAHPPGLTIKYNVTKIHTDLMQTIIPFAA